MICLQVHNDYQIVGGETKTAQKIADLLEKNEIEVIRYYKSNRQFESAGKIKKAMVGIRALYNRETVREIKALLKERRVDFALIHNTSPLISNSIYRILVKQRVPIIKYLQNYNLICLNGALDQGKICEACQKRAFRGVIKKCYKNSYIFSYIKLLMKWDMQKHYLNKVTAFMANSDYVRRQYIKAGVVQDKICVMYNYIENICQTGQQGLERNSFLYFGRISREKGVFTVLKAFGELRHLQLRILGNGELVEELQDYIDSNRMDNVIYLGSKTGEELENEIYRAKWVIVSSEWDEPLPRTILEAYAKGTPVIGTDRGGIPEMIREGRTGFIYEGGNGDALIAALRQADTLSGDEYEQMRRHCQEEVEEQYTEERYMERFIGCLEKNLKSNDEGIKKI